jgi:Uma2 family endonuclease
MSGPSDAMIPTWGAAPRSTRGSTERDDRGSKFAHYRRLASLQDYVLVSQSEPRIEVFSRGDDGWTLRFAGSGDSARLPSIDVNLDVDELYADRIA